MESPDRRDAVDRKRVLIAAEQNAVISIAIPLVGQIQADSFVLSLDRPAAIGTVVCADQPATGWSRFHSGPVMSANRALLRTLTSWRTGRGFAFLTTLVSHKYGTIGTDEDDPRNSRCSLPAGQVRSCRARHSVA